MTRSTSPSDRDPGNGRGQASGDRERPWFTPGATSSGAPPPGALRGPAFDIPAAPPGGNDAGAELIRIVDPAGKAIAWIATGSKAGCTGFAVRRPGSCGDRWTHAFPPHSAGGRGALPDGAWISPILVLPEIRATANRAGPGVRARPLHLRFFERDPTAVVLAAEAAPGVPGVRLRFAARLDDAALWLTVEASNAGSVPVAVGLGLRFGTGDGSSPVPPRDVPPEEISGNRPDRVAARWMTPEGAPFALRVMEDVRFVGNATAPPPVAAPFLMVLGYRPSHTLDALPPGGLTSVSVRVAPLDEPDEAPSPTAPR